eukprot:3861263-Prymnesium_polylepis.2
MARGGPALVELLGERKSFRRDARETRKPAHHDRRTSRHADGGDGQHGEHRKMVRVCGCAKRLQVCSTWQNADCRS